MKTSTMGLPGESELGHWLDRGTWKMCALAGRWIGELWSVRQLPDSKLAVCAQHMQEGQAKALSVALSEGCPWQNDSRWTSQALAFGLSHVIHLFHPSRLVVEWADAGGPLLTPWRASAPVGHGGVSSGS